MESSKWDIVPTKSWNLHVSRQCNVKQIKALENLAREYNKPRESGGAYPDVLTCSRIPKSRTFSRNSAFFAKKANMALRDKHFGGFDQNSPVPDFSVSSRLFGGIPDFKLNSVPREYRRLLPEVRNEIWDSGIPKFVPDLVHLCLCNTVQIYTWKYLTSNWKHAAGKKS